MKSRTFKIIFIFLLISGLLLALGVWYATPRLPIISAYVAKNVCSCVFVAGWEPVDGVDFRGFPLNLGNYTIDHTRKTVRSTVFGLAPQEVIYRPGLGCALRVNPALPYQSRGADLPALRVRARSDHNSWPEGRIYPDSFPPTVNRSKLKAAIASAFDPPGSKPTHFTRGVVVIYQNKYLSEQYTPGFDRNTPQLGWSMTKSIVNAWIGILVNQHKINLLDPAPVKAWQNDPRRAISWLHLLQMCSGLAWKEEYSTVSSATQMLFTGSQVYQVAIQSPAAAKPGEVWQYSSGTTNILSGLIRKVIGNDALYHRFPYEALFYPLGIGSATIEADASGTFVGSSFGWATPRDWARLGLLYLNDGVWQGQRILPEKWVHFSTTPAPASEGVYGAHIWLNRSGKFPDLPRDMYYFAGYQGQRVFIIPSRQLVIVRMGISEEDTFDFNEWMERVLEVFG
ncbi:MAG: serine hydrolase [Bacteroidia bacterium]|nr:serine hydrolase [Bacteroidia bacterium]